jgi:hypothetical protein
MALLAEDVREELQRLKQAVLAAAYAQDSSSDSAVVAGDCLPALQQLLDAEAHIIQLLESGNAPQLGPLRHSVGASSAAVAKAYEGMSSATSQLQVRHWRVCSQPSLIVSGWSSARVPL